MWFKLVIVTIVFAVYEVVIILLCHLRVRAVVVSVMSPNPSKGYDRCFCIRMKSTLTKRGVHFKSSGYRVRICISSYFYLRQHFSCRAVQLNEVVRSTAERQCIISPQCTSVVRPRSSQAVHCLFHIHSLGGSIIALTGSIIPSAVPHFYVTVGKDRESKMVSVYGLYNL